jgi:hypothetical protein
MNLDELLPSLITPLRALLYTSNEKKFNACTATTTATAVARKQTRHARMLHDDAGFAGLNDMIQKVAC